MSEFTHTHTHTKNQEQPASPKFWFKTESHTDAKSFQKPPSIFERSENIGRTQGMRGIAPGDFPFWQQVLPRLFSECHVYSLLYSENGPWDVPCTLSKIPIIHYKTASLKGPAETTACLRFPRSCNNFKSAGKASIILFWNYNITHYQIQRLHLAFQEQ